MHYSSSQQDVQCRTPPAIERVSRRPRMELHTSDAVDRRPSTWDVRNGARRRCGLPQGKEEIRGWNKSKTSNAQKEEAEVVAVAVDVNLTFRRPTDFVRGRAGGSCKCRTRHGLTDALHICRQLPLTGLSTANRRGRSSGIRASGVGFVRREPARSSSQSTP